MSDYHEAIAQLQKDVTFLLEGMKLIQEEISGLYHWVSSVEDEINGYDESARNMFGLTANIIDAAFLILGKTGKFLNARGIRACFLIDLVCLSYWFVTDLQRGLYSQGISCTVSMALCIYGFRRWGKNSPTSPK